VPGVGLVVFSGQAGGDFFNDLWAYTPETDAWRQLPSAGSVPEPRYGSCAALAPDGRLWISHGFTDKGRFFDTRAYDFAKSEWVDVSRDTPVPVIRCLHDCVWAADGRFVLFGGQTNGVAALGDLWARPVGGDWQPQADPPLKARQLYAVATLGNVAWIFGGADRDHAPLRDLWTLDLRDLSWHEVSLGGSIPPARLSGTLVSDPARSRLLLFGGKSSQTTYDDLWELGVT
jgi:N-acetylneuraminic acid mutarotase